MSTREREVKLGTPPGFELPPLTDPGGDVFEGPAETVELDAAYHDSPDLRLTRAGALLRHRNDEGWTVKLPAAADEATVLARDEHHFPGAPGSPPDAALDLLRALLRSTNVEPVARLHTTRCRVPIHALDGTPVAEVVDDRVEVVEGATFEATFRELEVELSEHATDGQRAALLARLRAAGAGTPDLTPKIVRALGSRATAPPDVPVPDIDAESTVDEVARAALAACVAKIIAHDPGVRLSEDPEDVHQARVATRKLRSHLRTFYALFDEEWATGLRDELRWLGDVLGAVRDADVLLDRLERNVGRLPDVDRPSAEKLLDRLRADLERRRQRLAEALRSDRYVILLDQLVLVARRPRLLLRINDEGDDILREVVRQGWQQLSDAVGDLPENPPDASLHKVRIDAKRARYAAEAVAPKFGKPARAFGRAMTELQDVLGEHQDAVIATEWLRAAAAHVADEEIGFAAGQLAGLEHTEALAARAEWPAAWKGASRRRLRACL